MADFPADVVTDILSRLPVKPLLRFRCVAKPWCTLIDSRDFMKLHLQRSIESENNHSLILRYYNIYSVSLDDTLEVAVEIDQPLKSDDFVTKILGSCDGLVLLLNDLENVCIWNPHTKKHQKLPISKIESPDYFTSPQYKVYGIGYDSVSDDYKVVRMVQFYGVDSEVRVYSLKSNSWRRINDFPYYFCNQPSWGKFANGSLHWVVASKYEVVDPDCFIAAFNLGTEEYQLVPVPDFSDKKFHMNVEVLGGCLCLLCNYFDHRVDVWVMKDYGVKESWTKLFSVAQPQHISSFQFVIPLNYSKDGSQVHLLQDNEKLVWFDLDHNVVTKTNVRGLPKCFAAEVCVQSLVPLSGRGSAIKKTKKKKKNKNKKVQKGDQGKEKKIGEKRITNNTSSSVGAIPSFTTKPLKEPNKKKARLDDVVSVLGSMKAGLDAVARALEHGNARNYDERMLYDEVDKATGLSDISKMKIYQVLARSVDEARSFLACPVERRDLWLRVRFESLYEDQA